jgi:hypothetical protein
MDQRRIQRIDAKAQVRKENQGASSTKYPKDAKKARGLTKWTEWTT